MHRSSRNRFVLVLALIAAMLGSTTVASAASLSVSRVAGTDRYATAAAISQTSHPDGADIVFVATGLNHADSVAITAVGGKLGPVLLTQPGALPEVTRAELQRLAPDVVYVLGGTRAVSDAVQFAIVKSLPGSGVTVERIWGPDRYATAVAISKKIAGSASTVWLADGHDYASGITAAAAAGIEGGVLLTTDANNLPSVVANELARLSPARLVAVGNLSAAVVSAASDFAGETVVITASSSADLSVRVSEALWSTTTDVILASSANFPDALAAAAWSVGTRVPLLLTNPATLEDSTACELLRMRATGAFIAGGPNAVSTALATELTDIKPRKHGCSDPILVEIPDPNPATEEIEVTLYDLVTSPDSTRAYAINNDWNSVEVIDVIDGVWLGRISVGSDPTDLDISVDGKTLYVVNNGSQTVSIVDLTKPFAQAERNRVPLASSGASGARSLAIEVASDGAVFIVPSQLEATTDTKLQQLNPAGTMITEVDDPAAPLGVVQSFHSVDHRIVGMIAPGVQDLELFTYADGTWTNVGAWGRPVAEISYGTFDQNGVSSTGDGTATVFSANGQTVLGTVTSESSVSYGLAVAPLQVNCPQTRGTPGECTSLAYSVVVTAGGLSAVEVLDITVGTNVDGSFRVIETIELQSTVASYGGKNQPGNQTLINQAVVTADARSLVIAAEKTVEVLPIG